MKKPRCRGKRAYENELEAKIALAGTFRRPGETRRQESRYYRCERCKRWHLTSAPLKEA